MNKSDTIASLAAALNKAQAEMSGAKKSANVIPKRQKAVPRHTVELS